MNPPSSSDQVLKYVRVPISLIQHPERFGGVRDGDCLLGDLVFRNGRVEGMRCATLAEPEPRMVLPKLTECHVHLDKCHTVTRIAEVGGNLQEAIEAQGADKLNWTVQDIRLRATRGLEELIASGCDAVRSHVDWGSGATITEPPPAWFVLTELAEEFQDRINLQLSPLIGVDDLAQPAVAENVARIIARNGGVLGVFVFDQPERQDGISAAFEAAATYGLALDFHVDEGLSEGLDGVGMIAQTAIDTGFEGPVLCGHACSLMNVTGDPLKKLTEKIEQSGIFIASLPTTNLYLQGRNAGTPDRRGITRLTELRAAGVPVVVGTDNVRDAFCPLGRHDPRHSLMLAVLAAHLDPPFADLLPMITTTARQAMGLTATYVDQACVDNLLLFSARSTSDLLTDPAPPLEIQPELQGEFA